jgi:hypothetical protein
LGGKLQQGSAKDGFDIRTVKKHIDLAKEEREAREARTLVLRSALEKHYEDLRDFAEKLDSKMRGVTSVQSAADDDLIEAALRQHLPRSPMWASITKHKVLCHTLEEQKQLLKNTVEKMVEADKHLKVIMDAGLREVVPGVVDLLVFEVERWLNGNKEHTLKDSLVLEPAHDGLVNPRFGFSHMGAMSPELANRYMPAVHDAIGDFESRIKVSDEYLTSEKTCVEISRLKGKLREELAIIRLRRIIPGRCKYCPL